MSPSDPALLTTRRISPSCTLAGFGVVLGTPVGLTFSASRRLLNGLANVPSPPSAADLSTKIVRASPGVCVPSVSAAARNQKLKTPPGKPSESPSKAVGIISGRLASTGLSASTRTFPETTSTLGRKFIFNL